MRVSIFRKTDIGRFRSKNEDNFAILTQKISETCPAGEINPWISLSLEGAGALLCVIDGMGGAGGGDVASQMIAKSITANAQIFDTEKIDSIPMLALSQAHKSVREFILENPEYSKMGAVATACYLFGENVYGAQVGDTRLYLFRDGSLKQISSDQTLVADLVRQGKITQKEAETHPQRNVVMQAIGPMDNLSPVSFKFGLKPKDKILMCSDGLYGFVDSDQIIEILNNSSGEKSVDGLVSLANENAGKDNITVIIAEIDSLYSESTKN